jgi:hypothetical protein
MGDVEGETFGTREAVGDKGVFGSSGEDWEAVDPDETEAERRREMKIGSEGVKVVGFESFEGGFIVGLGECGGG